MRGNLFVSASLLAGTEDSRLIDLLLEEQQSLTAVERFAERLADVAIPDHHPEAPPAPKARSDRQRQRDVGRAESDLKAAGI